MKCGRNWCVYCHYFKDRSRLSLLNQTQCENSNIVEIIVVNSKDKRHYSWEKKKNQPVRKSDSKKPGRKKGIKPYKICKQGFLAQTVIGLYKYESFTLKNMRKEPR